MINRPGPYPQFTGWSASKELFLNPPHDFRPAAYWFWSNEVDPKTFRGKLEEMRNSGIYSFWIQPRLGYPMEEFLSPKYFELYRQALDIALELDMYVGIYDDYNWITGHCGGRTVKESDDYRESHTFWVEVPVKDGVVQEKPEISGIGNLLTGGHKEALTWLYEDGKGTWDDWQVLSAYTYKRSEVVAENTVQQITNRVKLASTNGAGCSLAIEGTLDQNATHMLALVTARNATSRMIDYLNPEAIEAFIRVGYEPYYRELKDYWDHIWAMFCDEPYSGLYTWDQMEGTLGTSLMYNPDFYTEFKDNKGYDIKEHLYALIWPTDQNSTKWRTDFYQVYAERVQRVFFKPLAQWSHDHDVLFVGHELMTQLNGHWAFTTTEGFDVVANFGADHFGIGELKDVSTTDSGGLKRNIAAKLASSVAHVYGKNGSMLEQYTPGFATTSKDVPAARGDWDLNAQTLKQQMDFFAVQGLTQFLWHGYFQSNDIVGDNKALYSQRFDFPPGINYEPWFRYFKQMSDANARLAYFLSLGTHVAPVAVLYPLRTYWSEGRADLFSQEGAFLNEHLTRLHFDYDFIDERNLLSATIKDGQLGIGDEYYKVLALPAVATLQDEQVVQVIEEFAQSGGAIIFSGRIPSATQAGGIDKKIEERLTYLVETYDRVVYLVEPLSSSANGPETLLETLEDLEVRSVSITEDEQEDMGSFYCLREDDQYLYLAIVNEDERTKNIEIVLPGVQGVPEIWDVETGKTTPWLYYRQTEQGLVVGYQLAAIEANCFRIERREEQGLYLTDISGKIRTSQVHEDGVTVQVEVENTKDLEFTVAGLTQQDAFSIEITEHGKPVNYEVKVNSTGASIQVPQRELASSYKCDDQWELVLENGSSYPINDGQGWEKQGLESYSGGATYTQEIEVSPELALEHVRIQPSKVCHTFAVILNGKDCGIRAWEPYALDVSEAIQTGVNQLEILVTNTAGNSMYHDTQYDVKDKAESGLIGPVTFEPYRLLNIMIKHRRATGGR